MMQSMKVKGIEKLDAALGLLLNSLPKDCENLKGKIEEIMKNDPNETQAEALAVQAVQRFANKASDRLEE